MRDQYISNSLLDTERIARDLASELAIGSVVLLKGTLGAGKTALAKYLISALVGKDVDVLSPTFNLVKEYRCEQFPIYHFDLYRLKNKNELYELDIENCFESGIAIVEWPEIAEDIIYNKTIDISIEITGVSQRVFWIKHSTSAFCHCSN